MIPNVTGGRMPGCDVNEHAGSGAASWPENRHPGTVSWQINAPAIDKRGEIARPVTSSGPSAVAQAWPLICGGGLGVSGFVKRLNELRQQFEATTVIPQDVLGTSTLETLNDREQSQEAGSSYSMLLGHAAGETDLMNTTNDSDVDSQEAQTCC